MSSLDDYTAARERGDTVGHRWKEASDMRASLQAADPFREAVRLSSEHPEPFPIDPNAPKAPALTLAPFDRSAIDEWNEYLSQGAR